MARWFICLFMMFKTTLVPGPFSKLWRHVSLFGLGTLLVHYTKIKANQSIKGVYPIGSLICRQEPPFSI